MKANAAERHRSYMLSQIVWPIKHINVGLFIDRVNEINSYLECLPSLKDERGSPQAMPRGNVPFTDIERCNMVLTALSFNFASAFWTSKGAGHFPNCLKMLKEDLELVAPTYAVMANLVAQVKQGIPQATSKPEDKVKMKSPDDPILNKSKEFFLRISLATRRRRLGSCARTVRNRVLTPCTRITRKIAVSGMQTVHRNSSQTNSCFLRAIMLTLWKAI